MILSGCPASRWLQRPTVSAPPGPVRPGAHPSPLSECACGPEPDPSGTFFVPAETSPQALAIADCAEGRPCLCGTHCAPGMVVVRPFTCMKSFGLCNETARCCFCPQRAKQDTGPERFSTLLKVAREGKSPDPGLSSV